MAIAMKIEIKGLAKLRDNFRNSPALVYDGLKVAVNKSALVVAQRIKNVTPKKTTALAGSIRPAFNSGLTATISPHKNYAIYVHEGTRPHEIRPVSKKALFWKGALHPVRKVMHPGTKGVPFVEIGVNDSVPEVEKIFNSEVNNILNKLSKV